MIIALCIVGYVIVGVVAGRLIYNEYLDEYYQEALQKNSGKFVRGETKEERALAVAWNQMQRSDSWVTWVALGGFFWPIALVFFILALILGFLWDSLSKVLKSSAERETSKAVTAYERKKELDAQEKAFQEERERLISIAKSMNLDTTGLDQIK